MGKTDKPERQLRNKLRRKKRLRLAAIKNKYKILYNSSFYNIANDHQYYITTTTNGKCSIPDFEKKDKKMHYHFFLFVDLYHPLSAHIIFIFCQPLYLLRYMCNFLPFFLF